jgi:hypothetical protein
VLAGWATRWGGADMDPWAKVNADRDAREKHEAREAEAKGASQAIKDRVAAGEKRREEAAKPPQRYKPNFSILAR